MSTDILIPRGLPAPLPAGEQLLWQGAPGWRAFACSVFHIRAITLYFVALAVWHAVSTFNDGRSIADALGSTLPLLGLGALAIAVLTLIAWLIGRTTVYTITSRRVVLHIGIALPMTINVPFRIVASASLARHADGSADLPLKLSGSDRLAYLLLWPHVRPWRYARAEPMLRCVPDGDKVAETLARAAAAATASPVQPKPSDAAAQPDQGAPWPGATAAA